MALIYLLVWRNAVDFRQSLPQFAHVTIQSSSRGPMRTEIKCRFDNTVCTPVESETDRRLLIVHDVDSERNEIANSLAKNFTCTTATSVQEALAHLSLDEYALVILNPQMVLLDEEYFHNYFRNLCPDIAVMFIGHSRVNLCREGLVHIQSPFEPLALEQAVSQVLNARQLDRYRKHNELLEKENVHFALQLRRMKLGFIETSWELLKAKDDVVHRRSLVARRYVELLSDVYSLNEELRESLRAAVVLRELNQASSLGFLDGRDLFAYAQEILRFESENFDGTGVPIGLEGSEIPIASRILRVAVEGARVVDDSGDVSGDLAISELNYRAGCELDPGVVESLLKLISENSVRFSVELATVSTESVGKAFFAVGD